MTLVDEGKLLQCCLKYVVGLVGSVFNFVSFLLANKKQIKRFT